LNKEDRICLISCGILKEEILRLIQEDSLSVDAHFIEEGLHADYDRLEKELSQAIEEHLESYAGVVVLYGDVCLGFNDEMKNLVANYRSEKVDCLNCFDCLLGGKGIILESDPNHIFFYLNPAWMNFWNKFKRKPTDVKEEVWEKFSPLKGIVLLDSLGNLDNYKNEIEEFREYTGLSILEKREIGLEGVKGGILEAIKRLKEKTG